MPSTPSLCSHGPGRERRRSWSPLIGELVGVTKKVYATERIVFAEFEVRYTCPDETGARGPATLIVQGDGSYGAEA
jgi:hypothetical protein